MQINVAGRHMGVPDQVREYAIEKIGKVAKIHDRDDMQVDVVLHVEKNPSNKNRDVAEVTARMRGITVRAEEAAPDMFAAIDLVSEKLEKQMRKYKTKLVDRRNGGTFVKTAAGDREIPATDVEMVDSRIVKTKTVEARPMTADEAIMQMELLGHDFFVFTHAETEAVNVLYRRHDGDYGLIETGE
jgi:putative sigma-54 modulation protein